jgi:small basic protein
MSENNNDLYKDDPSGDEFVNSEHSFDNETPESIERKFKLKSQFENGVSWFYWIAILSVVNTILYLIGSSWNFIVGLGVTQIIDDIAITSEGATRFVAIGISLCIAALFAALGALLKRNRKNGIFIFGIVAYGLDALLFIFIQDWISIAFHAFAIYGFFRGIKANNELKGLES